jgi:threonine/homoserine/homoserine lactone efflux protein
VINKYIPDVCLARQLIIMDIVKYIFQLKNSLRIIIWLAAVIVFFPAHTAHAYIDAGAGSYVIQIIIGFFLGAAYAVKHYWRRIVAWIKSRKNKKDK